MLAPSSGSSVNKTGVTINSWREITFFQSWRQRYPLRGNNENTSPEIIRLIYSHEVQLKTTVDVETGRNAVPVNHNAATPLKGVWASETPGGMRQYMSPAGSLVLDFTSLDVFRQPDPSKHQLSSI